MSPKFATNVSFISLYKVSFQYTMNCFADISTEEACTVLLGN